MTLYLKPPRGIITFNDLQKCVEHRLEFFKSTSTTSIPVHCIEYLMEDSAFDRTGHFTFRLAAVKYPNFLPFFINSEVELLRQRLHSYNSKWSIQVLKKLLRHSKESKSECKNNKNITDFLNVLVSVLIKMLSNNYRNHIFGFHTASEHCNFFILEVPFNYCYTLLSNHDFELKNGFIQIPCNKWKELFLSLFNTYLRITIKEMIYSSAVHHTLEDKRINSIMSYLHLKVFGSQISNPKILDFLDIDIKLFPLCMQNLDGVLKNNHRLAHSERIDLSLFLKDIGLSLNSSISYWKSEYSKEYSNCTNCKHSWQENEKKYVYSIRHLYGLEGSRKTYVSKSCNYFQNSILNSAQEGGCPFKHFDDEKLKMLLLKHFNDNFSNYIDTILVERRTDPSRACKLVAKKAIQCRGDSDINFNNPVQYFLQMKSMKT